MLGLNLDAENALRLIVVVILVGVLLRLLLKANWARVGVPLLVASAGVVLLAQWGPATPPPKPTPSCAAPCIKDQTGPSTTTTTTPNVADQLKGGGERALRNINKAVTGTPFEPDAWEWALAGVIALLLMRWWAGVLLRGAPSAVEVADITDASADKPDASVAPSLAAELRDRLAGVGRLPGSVTPSGQVDNPLVNVASELPKGKLVVTILQNLVALLSPTSGYRVTGTLRRRPDPADDTKTQYGLTVQVTESGVNKVRQVKTAWADTPSRAACDAADEIVVWLTSGVEAKETPWSDRWTRAKALCQYLDGVRIETDVQRADEPERTAGLRKAADLFLAAAAAERANLPVRLRLGSLLEQLGQWLDAIELYVETGMRWPESFSVRYRLAAACGFVDAWTAQLAAASPARRAEFETRLATAYPAFEGIDFTDRAAVLAAVATVWEGAEDAMRWGAVVRGWIVRLGRGREWRDRRAFTARLAPWNGQRRRWVNIIRMGELGIEIQQRRAKARTNLGDADVGEFRDAVDGLSRWGRATNWQVRYNAACALTHLAAASGRLELLDDAVRALDRSYWDPNSKLSLAWVGHDPDLDFLTNGPGRPRYLDWRNAFTPSTGP